MNSIPDILTTENRENNLTTLSQRATGRSPLLLFSVFSVV